jgi:hypothetical protein
MAERHGRGTVVPGPRVNLFPDGPAPAREE